MVVTAQACVDEARGKGLSGDHPRPDSVATIVNIVAVVGRGMPGVAHTCAARAGVIALSKTVAIEWAPLGIRINCVAPGAIMTEGAAKTSEGGGLSEEERQALGDAMTARIPVGRMGEPDDIAKVAVFLASSAADYVTGQTIISDGGILLS